MAAKGFKPDRTYHRLTFDDYPGLVVVFRPLSVGGMLEFVKLLDQVEGLDEEHFKPSDLGLIEKFFAAVAGALKSWNVLGEDDEPVPATYEGVMSQDVAFVRDIAEKWAKSAIVVDPTSPAGSPSGGTSPEAALAAASRSRSPGSS